MLNDEEMTELKSLLEKLEKDLADEVDLAKVNSQPVALDQQAVGRVSRIDAIQQQQMHLSSLRRLEQRLEMTRAALSRIQLKEFGECAVCEEPISFERLKARPESPVCFSCAQKRDRRNT